MNSSWISRTNSFFCVCVGVCAFFLSFISFVMLKQYYAPKKYDCVFGYAIKNVYQIQIGAVYFRNTTCGLESQSWIGTAPWITKAMCIPKRVWLWSERALPSTHAQINMFKSTCNKKKTHTHRNRKNHTPNEIKGK